MVFPCFFWALDHALMSSLLAMTGIESAVAAIALSVYCANFNAGMSFWTGFRPSVRRRRAGSGQTAGWLEPGGLWGR